MSLPFLAYLGVPQNASERDIKRAYARMLKQIDQATDAAGFQALREAYEAALHWHGRTDAAGAHVEPLPVHSPEPLPLTQTGSPAPAAPPDSPGPHLARNGETTSSRAPRWSPDSTRPLPAPHPSTELAALFQHFMDRLATLGDMPSMRQAIGACLADPCLQSLEARDTFEGLIVQTLAEGWKPGHDILMAAAIEFFQWHKDSHHLKRFGRAGSEIDQSISDQVMFDSQPPSVRERLKEVIRVLRAPPRADDAAKAEIHRTDLELMLVQFGSWLRINAPAERVRQWRQWAKNPPEHSALLANTQSSHHAAAPTPQPQQTTTRPTAPQLPLRPVPERPGIGGKKMPALWFLLGLCVGMAAMFIALEGRHLVDLGKGRMAQPANPADDPLDAVKAAYKPRQLPPGYGPPQGPPYHRPPPPILPPP